MYAIYFEEHWGDGSSYTSYVIRESIDRCVRALDFFNVSSRHIAYEAEGEFDTRNEALAFCFSEWFNVTVDDAAEALEQDDVRKRFESWELKVIWPGDEDYDDPFDDPFDDEYWAEVDAAYAELEREKAMAANAA